MSNAQKTLFNIVFHKNFLVNDIMFIYDKNKVGKIGSL